MSNYKINLMVWTVLFLTVSQIAAAQDANQNEFGPNRFPEFDGVRIIESLSEVSFNYVINGVSVTEEACFAAKETQAESCKIEEQIKMAGSIGSVAIPKFAAPFQVQLVTTPYFKSDEDWKRIHPTVPVWDLRHVCGGSLIDKNWVLTAAHCFKGVEGQLAKKFGVRLGVGDLSDTSAQTIAIKDVIIPKEYVSGVKGHDIALVRIEETNAEQNIDQFNPVIDREFDPNDISQALVLKGGERFLTRSANGIKLWDTKTGKELREYEENYANQNLNERLPLLEDAIESDQFYFKAGNGVTRIDFSLTRPDFNYDHGNIISKFKLLPNDQKMLVRGAGIFTLWNLKTDQKILQIKDDTIRDFLFVNPRRYLTSHNDSHYRLFDMNTGALIKEIKTRNWWFKPLVISGGKKLLIPDGETLYMIDTETGGILATFPISKDYLSASISSNEKYIVLNENYDPFEIWNLKNNKKEATPKDKAGKIIKSANFTVSKNHIIFVNSNSVILWDIKKGNVRYEAPIDIGNYPISTIFFNNGRRVAISYPQGATQVLDTKTGKVKFTINHSVPISNTKLSKDETFILSYSDLGLAEVWDAKTGKAIERVFHGAPVLGTQLFNNNKSLLTWGSAPEARLWDVRSDISRRSERDSSELQSARNSDPRQDPSVKTIKFAQRPIDEASNVALFTYGWGKTRNVEGYEPSILLRMMAFRKISNQSCSLRISTTPEKKAQISKALKEKTVFCARDNARKTCVGDSGGPVIYGDTLVGVVSQGGNKCEADGKIGVYTNVAAYADWIAEEMNKPRPE